MGILSGKRILVTGVITPDSIAFRVAELALAEGAQIVLTGFGRLSLVERVARRLPGTPPVIEVDVTRPEHLDALPGAVAEHMDGVDGILHSIAFAPASCLGGFMSAEWEDVATTVHVSAYSYASLVRCLLPMMGKGSAVVGLTFDGSLAWPTYDWMGVAKAALESTSRYLARELGPLGIRSNLVAAGPLRTVAAKSIPGLQGLEPQWRDRAPLDWDMADTEPVARTCVGLLSDWFPATTGEIIHADGGYHAIGA